MRVGCPEEDQPQTASPGIVDDSEMLVFALICPVTADANSVAKFEKGKLKDRNVSVSRSAYSSFVEMIEKVVTPQIQTDNTRRYLGFQVSSCQDIRALLLFSHKEEATDRGALCVIDDSYDDYVGHARMGYSEHEPQFWKRNNREAIRGNLAELFKVRGTFQAADRWP